MHTAPLKMGLQRGEYSRFSLGRVRRHDAPTPGQDRGLLNKDAGDAPADNRHRPSYINEGQDDQMEVRGYAPDPLKLALTWLLMVASLGTLRLVFHWVPHWYLLATCSPCALDAARHILVTECYKSKHRVRHVKPLLTITADSVEPTAELPVHWRDGQFRRADRLRYFRCKKLTYVYEGEHGRFGRLRALDADVRCDALRASAGLSEREQALRRLVYGRNEIVVPERTVLALLFLEVLNPFYVFQIMSFCFWFSDNYYYYAAAILAMSAGGVAMSVLQTRRNQRNLQSTVSGSDLVTVVRDDGRTEVVSTALLVPGDVLQIPAHGCVMHCDAVLLAGNCIVNESMLTGESVPVTKTPAPATSAPYDPKEHARHTLFCGTRVIQTRYYGGEKVLAVVIRTGFTTAKGGLIRSILYPPPVDFRFENDSYRFVGLLAAIASIGFVYTVITKYMRGVDVSDLVLEALDLITIVVPPALPAAMTVGRLYAQKRLKENNIYCISPRTINVSGSIDCVCFDKTGTLTEDGLDMLCVVPVMNRYFGPPVKDVRRMDCDEFFCGLASCHSLTIIDKQLTGDPLDLKMFESTGWEVEEHDTSDNTKYNMIFPTVVRAPRVTAATEDPDDPTGRPQIGVIREFPFSSSCQRMGVIVRKLTGPHFEYYCKGSPEMLLNFVRPETVPDDFHHVLEAYTQQGYRVIALAHRQLARMSYAKVQRVPREAVESDLAFLGFIVLENRLKSDTTPCIAMLSSARIRTVMVTGDNILTAVSVARECGIVAAAQSVITVEVDAGNPPQLRYTLTSTKNRAASNGCPADLSVTDSASIASVETLESALATSCQESDGSKRPQSLYNNYRFALTGKVWAAVRTHHPDLLPRFATRGAIFARMSPEQKQQLVEELQALGYYVAMCGDGANDCGALKAAHTGISLSDAESSVASPFTSRNPNITCVPDIIREGRAALVTSFGIFKYMASYSLCQFVSVMILYSMDSNLSDVQYLYIDLCIISTFAFFFGRTRAYQGRLVRQAPLSSLMSLSPVLSLVLQLVLVVAFQVAAFEHVQTQPWYEPYNATLKDASPKHYGYENYAVFSVSAFQYIILAVVFSKGRPYRQSVFSNGGFLAGALLLGVFSAYLAVYPAEAVAGFFSLDVPPSLEFRLAPLGYALAHFLLATLVEVVLIDHCVFKRLRFRYHDVGRSKRRYLAVERDLQADSRWPTLTSDYRSAASPLSPGQPPRYTAEIVVENERPFAKHHVFSQLFTPAARHSSEIQLNPVRLTAAADTDSKPLSGSVPNVSAPQPSVT